MPRPPATTASSPRRCLPLAAAVLLALQSLASAQTPAEGAPASSEPGLRLRMDPQLRERPPAGQQPTGTTFARARRIEGTIDDRIVLEGDAELRREGSVVRGDRITYTQATDEVNVEGHARVFREGATFAGPRLDFRIEAQTGAMPNANFSYAPRRGRSDASLIDLLGLDPPGFVARRTGGEARLGHPRLLVAEELDQLEARVGKITVPLSYADELYALRNHIELVRHRLLRA